MRSSFPQTWHRMGGNTVTDELGLSRVERREAFDGDSSGAWKCGDSIRLCVGGMYGECDVTGIVA